MDDSSQTARPVGHEGTRVDIAEKAARAVSGWLGVLFVALCVAAAYLCAVDAQGSVWLPILLAVIVLTSLVIVPPGQTSVVQFFGTYVGTVRRRASGGCPLHGAAPDQHAGPQLRDRPP